MPALPDTEREVASTASAPIAPAPTGKVYLGEGVGGAGNSETPMEMPSLRRTMMLTRRALALRCPHCGVGKVLRSWGTVNERCSHCNFRFARSGDEYFTGAMLVNFIIAELLFAVCFTTAVVLTWPDVPWDAMTWIGVAGAVIVPIALFPFARVVWLTADTLIRPVMPEELEEELHDELE